MLRFRGRARISLYALALLATSLPIAASRSLADDDPQQSDTAALDTAPVLANDDPSAASGHIVRIDSPPTSEPLADDCDCDWAWQWAPTGLIYHSYLAGVHEPRMALVTISDMDGGAFSDATLGGRTGLLRFGNSDPVHPQGYQLDFYGAAIARLDLENQEDLNSCDYVFGFPITYGDERWQTKFGYAHLSAHLGDELAIRVPGTLGERVNYVRDSLVWGTSYYLVPAWRMYGEAGWAFNADGGAKPWEMQFGTELSRPGPSGRYGTPFLAVNGRMRQEQNYSGDLTAQIGLLRRGILGQTFRFGAHYYNGKSSQSEFFNTAEEQIGMGLWYDF